MALNVLPVRVEVPVLAFIFRELKRSTGNAMVRPPREFVCRLSLLRRRQWCGYP